MSFLGGALLGSGIGVSGSALSSVIQSIFVRPRKIGSFVADVTIEERHEDVMRVTEHPVERGSNISDHAYKQPAKVIIKCGWSNSSLHVADILSSGDLLSLIDPDYVKTVYARFLSLQSSRSLFGVQTGKRAYTNMIITRLSAVTDDKSENALMLTVECQEVIMATTQTVDVGSGGTSSMKSPELTGGTAEAGTKSLTPPVSGASFTGG
jgi:hypothetical protein